MQPTRAVLYKGRTYICVISSYDVPPEQFCLAYSCGLNVQPDGEENGECLMNSHIHIKISTIMFCITVTAAEASCSFWVCFLLVFFHQDVLIVSSARNLSLCDIVL